MAAIKRLLFVWTVVGAWFVYGQSDPSFSHYMFNPAAYNPAAIGDGSVAFASFQHRSQWAGYSSAFDGDGGAPSSQLVTMAMPVQGPINTAGALLSLDSQGPETTTRFSFGVAKDFSMTKGTLSVGVMPSFISRTIDFGQFRFEDPSEPLNTGNRESQSNVDLSAGLYFKNFSGFFLGVSVDHILSPSLIQVESNGLEASGKLTPLYYLHGGKKMDINRDIDITPSVLVRTNNETYALDISGIATFRDIMWGGVSYRYSESVVLLIGYNFLEDKELKVGYSFDYVVNDQEAKRPTSHEIFIHYDLPSLILGGRKAVKTPRFSF